MRRLDLVVGPNGAGKTTFISETLAPLLPGSRAVNADEIARRRWPADPERHGYDAARIAADTRAHLIAAGESFVAETVFSHPSKLDLIDAAHAGSYTVVLHALLVPEALAVERVRARVAAGGHQVPEQKIRKRYARLWPLVVRAVAAADLASVYDNAGIRGPVRIAQFSAGTRIGVARWPAWAPELLRAL